ncbi:MAG: hypothetical protein AB7G23_03895 [Vicinamibacterales bacterium]
MQRLLCSLTFVGTALLGSAASAQTFAVDARMIGMGGAGDDPSIASGMVPSGSGYHVIPLPLSLIQLFRDLDQFNPASDQFNPVRAVESAASPFHLRAGRGSGVERPEYRLVSDLVNGRVSRDLSTYRGFTLPTTTAVEGLASGAFGKTFRFAKQPTGAFQGVYVGAGPYLALGTSLDVDPRLSDVFSSSAPRYFPDTAFDIHQEAAVQLAMSTIIGYRARLALPGAAPPASAPPTGAGPERPSRDGIYVAANYRHLTGFRYLEPTTTIRLDTDARGLVATSSSAPPLVVETLQATSGSGRAVDLGVQVVRGPVEVGVGVNGLGNRIRWTGLSRTRYALSSLTDDVELTEEDLPMPGTDVTVTLPVVTSANMRVNAGAWSLSAMGMQGYNGATVRGGVERRIGFLALRGGAQYQRGNWNPTYGFGIGRRVALDVAFFGTRANLQRARETAVAVSMRITPAR